MGISKCEERARTHYRPRQHGKIERSPLYSEETKFLQYALKQPAHGEFPDAVPLSNVFEAIESHATENYGRGWNGSNWRFRSAFDPELPKFGIDVAKLSVSGLSFTGKTVQQAIEEALGKVAAHKLKFVIRFGKIVVTK